MRCLQFAQGVHHGFGEGRGRHSGVRAHPDRCKLPYPMGETIPVHAENRSGRGNPVVDAWSFNASQEDKTPICVAQILKISRVAVPRWRGPSRNDVEDDNQSATACLTHRAYLRLHLLTLVRFIASATTQSENMGSIL